MSSLHHNPHLQHELATILGDPCAHFPAPPAGSRGASPAKPHGPEDANARALEAIDRGDDAVGFYRLVQKTWPGRAAPPAEVVAYAAMHGEPHHLRTFAAVGGDMLNRDVFGLTPLQHALLTANEDTREWLLGVDDGLTAYASKGDYPLLTAIRAKNIHLVRRLSGHILEHPDKMQDAVFRALILAADLPQDTIFRTLFAFFGSACSSIRRAFVGLCVVKPHLTGLLTTMAQSKSTAASPALRLADVRISGDPLLAIAVRHQNRAAVQMLLELGASVDAYTSRGIAVADLALFDSSENTYAALAKEAGVGRPECILDGDLEAARRHAVQPYTMWYEDQGGAVSRNFFKRHDARGMQA